MTKRETDRRRQVGGVGALRRIAVFGLILSSVAWGASEIGARHWWAFELLTHFRVLHCLLTAVVAVLLLLASGKRTPARMIAAAAGLALAFVLAGPLLPYWFGGGDTPPGQGAPAKAMLLNLNVSNRRGSDVLRHLAAEDPDILLLLEVTPRWRSELAALDARYPHRVERVRDDPFGLWLLSRLPLRDARVIEDDKAGRLPSVAAEVEVGDGATVAIFGTHPCPPIGSAGAKRRNAQLRALASWAAAADAGRGRVLLMGDLNCSPFSPFFDDLLREGRLRDSAVGRGPSPTWFSGLPGLSAPIDHVLVGDGISVAARRIGPPVGSDHRSIVAEFVILNR